jgi:hypothetical protein
MFDFHQIAIDIAKPDYCKIADDLAKSEMATIEKFSRNSYMICFSEKKVFIEGNIRSVIKFLREI